MKSFLPLLLLLGLLPQNQSSVISFEGAPVTVLGVKTSKDRQEMEYQAPTSAPAPAMIPQNKNFERNRRANTSPGERDPNLDTVDGRSAALERAVQDSRAPNKSVEGYSYRAKVQNATEKVIEVIFWEYQFRDTPNSTVVSRRQFLCGVQIKPEKAKELKAFSVSGPSDVISVAALSDKTKSGGSETVVINRVEFADGSIWQRKDWKFGEVRLSYARAVATPWGGEMCRGL
jgi:hypothetical protein